MWISSVIKVFATILAFCECQNTLGSCTYDFTHPADFVFIMDRSRSLSPSHFSTMDYFIKKFIESFLILRPDHHRIAVVSYGTEATVDLDFVTVADSWVVAECELFLGNGLWESQVQYRVNSSTSPHGQRFKEAYGNATTLLRRSERSSTVPQYIWIFSDLESSTVLPISTDRLLLPNLQLYGYGIGGNIDWENFHMFAGNESCKIRNDTAWEDVFSIGTPNLQKINDTSFVPLMDTSLCPSGCAQCECPGNVREGVRCITGSIAEEPENDNEGSGPFGDNNVLWISVIVVGSVMLLLAVVVVCSCCIKRNKMRRNYMEDKPPHDSDPAFDNNSKPDVIPNGNHSTDIVYMNEPFENDLRQHGVEFKSGKRENVYINNTDGAPVVPPRLISQGKAMNRNNSQTSIPPYFAPIPPPQDELDSHVDDPSQRLSRALYSDPYTDLILAERSVFEKHANTFGGRMMVKNEGFSQIAGAHTSGLYDDRIPEASPGPSNQYQSFTLPAPASTSNKTPASKIKTETETETKIHSADSTQQKDLVLTIIDLKQTLRPVDRDLSFKRNTPSTEELSKVEHKRKSEKNATKGKKTKTSGEEDKFASKKFGTQKFRALLSLLEKGKSPK